MRQSIICMRRLFWGRLSAGFPAVEKIALMRFLKRMNKSVRCIAVEPLGAEILAGKKVVKPGHVIQGTGYNLIPPHWDAALADGFEAVSDDEAEEYRRLLATRESLYAGYSAAANACACVKHLRAAAGGASDYRVATVLCDTGLKY